MLHPLSGSHSLRSPVASTVVQGTQRVLHARAQLVLTNLSSTVVPQPQTEEQVRNRVLWLSFGALNRESLSVEVVVGCGSFETSFLVWHHDLSFGAHDLPLSPDHRVPCVRRRFLQRLLPTDKCHITGGPESH